MTFKLAFIVIIKIILIKLEIIKFLNSKKNLLIVIDVFSVLLSDMWNREKES